MKHLATKDRPRRQVIPIHGCARTAVARGRSSCPVPAYTYHRVNAIAPIMSTTPFVVKHDGKKHNIEHFLRFHPGGTNTLSVLRNADVTDRLFATHHSSAAYELLKDYRVDEEDVQKHIRENGDLEVSHNSKSNTTVTYGSSRLEHKHWLLVFGLFRFVDIYFLPAYKNNYCYKNIYVLSFITYILIIQIITRIPR